MCICINKCDKTNIKNTNIISNGVSNGVSNCDKNDNMNSKKKSYLLTLSFVRVCVCVLCGLSV